MKSYDNKHLKFRVQAHVGLRAYNNMHYTFNTYSLYKTRKYIPIC